MGMGGMNSMGVVRGGESSQSGSQGRHGRVKGIQGGVHGMQGVVQGGIHGMGVNSGMHGMHGGMGMGGMGMGMGMGGMGMGMCGMGMGGMGMSGMGMGMGIGVQAQDAHEQQRDRGMGTKAAKAMRAAKVINRKRIQAAWLRAILVLVIQRATSPHEPPSRGRARQFLSFRANSMYLKSYCIRRCFLVSAALTSRVACRLICSQFPMLIAHRSAFVRNYFRFRSKFSKSPVFCALCLNYI